MAELPQDVEKMIAELVKLKDEYQEMLDMGCELMGRFAKHKFRHIVELKRSTGG
jgi:hypothetical protein